MRSVYQVARDSDYDVLLTLVGENETRPVERLLDNRKIDGLILTRTLERDPLIPLLKARKVPLSPSVSRRTIRYFPLTMTRWAAAVR